MQVRAPVLPQYCDLIMVCWWLTASGDENNHHSRATAAHLLICSLPVWDKNTGTRSPIAIQPYGKENVFFSFPSLVSTSLFCYKVMLLLLPTPKTVLELSYAARESVPRLLQNLLNLLLLVCLSHGIKKSNIHVRTSLAQVHITARVATCSLLGKPEKSQSSSDKFGQSNKLRLAAKGSLLLKERTTRKELVIGVSTNLINYMSTNTYPA